VETTRTRGNLEPPHFRWSHRPPSEARMLPTIDYEATSVGSALRFRPTSAYLTAIAQGKPVPAQLPVNEYSYFYANPPIVRIDLVNGADQPFIVTEVRARVQRREIDSTPLLVALMRPQNPRTFAIDNEGSGVARALVVELEGWARPKLQHHWDVDCGAPSSILLDGRRTRPTDVRDILVVDLAGAVPSLLAADSTMCAYASVTFNGNQGAEESARFAIPVFQHWQPPTSGAPAPTYPVVRLGLRAGAKDSLYSLPTRLVVPAHGERALIMHILSDQSAHFIADLDVVSLDGTVVARRQLDLRTLQPKTGTGYFMTIPLDTRWLALPTNTESVTPALAAVGVSPSKRELWIVVEHDLFPAGQEQQESCEAALRVASDTPVTDSLRIVWISMSGIGTWGPMVSLHSAAGSRKRDPLACARWRD
jgi:hypothetical protein